MVLLCWVYLLPWQTDNTAVTSQHLVDFSNSLHWTLTCRGVFPTCHGAGAEHLPCWGPAQLQRLTEYISFRKTLRVLLLPHPFCTSTYLDQKENTLPLQYLLLIATGRELGNKRSEGKQIANFSQHTLSNKPGSSGQEPECFFFLGYPWASNHFFLKWLFAIPFQKVSWQSTGCSVSAISSSWDKYLSVHWAKINLVKCNWYTYL